MAEDTPLRKGRVVIDGEVSQWFATRVKLFTQSFEAVSWSYPQEGLRRDSLHCMEIGVQDVCEGLQNQKAISYSFMCQH